MHGHLNIKFVNAKQAKETYQYRNTKKLYKANVAIRYSKICREKQLTANHISMKINGKLLANLYDIYHCCVYSEKLLMVDRGTVRNM